MPKFLFFPYNFIENLSISWCAERMRSNNSRHRPYNGNFAKIIAGLQVQF